MTFNIPNIGLEIGTCGWLAKGLTNGTVQIRPGLTATLKKPGLWLYADGITNGECLAVFNPYNLSEYDLAGQNKCFEQVSDHEFGAATMIAFTPACRAYLQKVAEKWCEVQNAEREADSPEPLNAIRVLIGSEVGLPSIEALS